MLLAWEALLAQAQANRDTAEMMLIAMRESQGCHDVPFQDDELQAWFQDAHVGAAIAKASVDGYGNAVGKSDVEGGFLDTGEEGPRTPPRRCVVECHSTPPKATLLRGGRQAAVGSVDA